ncbi:MAG TPA: type IVB secretion system protein IcmH/DotU [Gammaproteobacteria bacterium]|nr:type IVB secretion system protein IcmH/DotU [Gammaproteobacteria bacterium]
MITTSTSNSNTQATTLPPLGQPTLTHHLITGERAYHRSKIFNTALGINPLIAAASPLFSLAANLSEIEAPPDLLKLSYDLTHEIKAFENNARSQHFRSETVLITRYLLCAYLDECILQSPWGKKNKDAWEPHLLLLFFHQEKDGSERFFVILERLSADPEVHIDVLELIYLCLNLGHLGKYRFLQDGKEMIDTISKRLFECIRATRGELKKELHIQCEDETKVAIAKIQFPVWLIVSFTFALLLTVYSTFSYLLGTHAEALYNQINALMV